MNRRSLLAVGLAAVALAATGCAPAWGVVTQATPDPFAGQAKFVLAPIDFTGLRVGEKAEADYLSDKDDKQRKSFADDKAGINEAFAKAIIERAHDSGIQIDLATGPEDGPFVIRPTVQSVEPGFYA